MRFQYSELFEKFEALEIDNRTFGHIEHVQVAFEMLHKYSYLDACINYAQNINKMATAAGAPEKFNLTITFAFLSLIAERLKDFNGDNFEGFIAANADLLEKDILNQWYSAEELMSDFARTHFLLPSKAA